MPIKLSGIELAPKNVSTFSLALADNKVSKPYQFFSPLLNPMETCFVHWHNLKNWKSLITEKLTCGLILGDKCWDRRSGKPSILTSTELHREQRLSLMMITNNTTHTHTHGRRTVKLGVSLCFPPCWVLFPTLSIQPPPHACSGLGVPWLPAFLASGPALPLPAFSRPCLHLCQVPSLNGSSATCRSLPHTQGFSFWSHTASPPSLWYHQDHPACSPLPDPKQEPGQKPSTVRVPRKSLTRVSSEGPVHLIFPSAPYMCPVLPANRQSHQEVLLGEQLHSVFVQLRKRCSFLGYFTPSWQKSIII